MERRQAKETARLAAAETADSAALEATVTHQLQLAAQSKPVDSAAASGGVPPGLTDGHRIQPRAHPPSWTRTRPRNLTSPDSPVRYAVSKCVCLSVGVRVRVCVCAGPSNTHAVCLPAHPFVVPHRVSPRSLPQRTRN